jgi:hypothetical protein
MGLLTQIKAKERIVSPEWATPRATESAEWSDEERQKTTF